ncbi:MAG: hypothetical protein JJ863_00990 [Deltaproteobacteria bacterium]|nr:hypothetical protein [Deltaproteobacteria bacterium]
MSEFWTLHGALVTANGSATVERRDIGGHPATMVLAVAGDLALPMLESVKDAFLKLARVDEASVAGLLATLTPPWVSGAAAAVSHGATVTTAIAGAGSCWRQHGGELVDTSAGAHPMAWGDGWLVSADFRPEAGDFFGTGTVDPDAASASPTPAFANDTLDDALRAALGDAAATVAATWVGELRARR